MTNFRQCKGSTLHIAHSWFASDPTAPLGYSWFACVGKAMGKALPDPDVEPSYPAYWQGIFDNIPQEAVDAFTEAWEAKRKEIGRGIAPKDTKTRAGLTAFMKALYELQVL